MGTAGLRHRPGLIVPVAFPTARGLIERLHSTGHEVAGNFPEAVDPAGTKPAPDDAEASKPRPGALFARLRQLNGVPSANVSVGADMLHEARARDQAGLCAVGLAGRSFSGRPNIQPVHFVHFASQALQTFTYLGRDGLMRYIALSLALLITGCALATATPPKVEVAAVELRGLGLLDQTLGVTLCVTNLNNTELDFRRVTVELEVAGAPLAESASETPVRLPPRSSVLVPFTVATTLRSLALRCWTCCARVGSSTRCAVACSLTARWRLACRSAAAAASTCSLPERGCSAFAASLTCWLAGHGCWRTLPQRRRPTRPAPALPRVDFQNT